MYIILFRQCHISRFQTEVITYKFLNHYHKLSLGFIVLDTLTHQLKQWWIQKLSKGGVISKKKFIDSPGSTLYIISNTPYKNTLLKEGYLPYYSSLDPPPSSRVCNQWFLRILTKIEILYLYYNYIITIVYLRLKKMCCSYQ